MKYRPLGNTGLQISEIGFGGWAIGGPVDLFGIPVGWSSVDDRESVAAIRRAYELGINFYDTADVYGSGHSEELISGALSGHEYILATKVGNARKDSAPVKLFTEMHIRNALESSLKRLKRDHVDLYQLHNPPRDVWESDEVFGTMKRLKEEGKIRFTGVSISTPEEGMHLIENQKADCLQVLFNVFNQEPAKDLFPLAEEKGVGIIVRVPLASGILTGKYHIDHVWPADDNRRNYLTPRRLREVIAKTDRLQEMVRDSGLSMTQAALAFVLRFSAVSAPIPGAKNPRQVEENAAASDIELPSELFHQMRQSFSGYNFFLRYGVKV